MNYKQPDTALWDSLWPAAFGVLYILCSGIKAKLYKNLQNPNHKFEKHSVFLACHYYLEQTVLNSQWRSIGQAGNLRQALSCAWMH